VHDKLKHNNSGSAISSIGVNEHWNNTNEMLYSRNLGTGEGIELVKIWIGLNGIDNGVISDKISIFPNPCLDFANLHFEFDQGMEMSIEVYNTNGQKVFCKDLGRISAGKNEVSMDLSSLNSGLYFVSIVNGKNTCAQRLVVQKSGKRQNIRIDQFLYLETTWKASQKLWLQKYKAIKSTTVL
jgi:hypothetical protein